MKKAQLNLSCTTRRQFLAHTLAASGAVLAPTLVPSAVFGAAGTTAPSQRLTMGLIGVGCMGRGHLRRLVDDPSIDLLAVCDVDRVRRDEAYNAVKNTYAGRGSTVSCTAYNDYREILARPDIDAVVIVTPDHWHTPMSIEAARAGKDVYCEKPISICIHEGRRLAEVVRNNGRIFQTGTQYRSIPVVRQVCDFVRAGKLGHVKSVFTLWNSLSIWILGDRFKPYAETHNIAKDATSFVPIDFPVPADPVPEGLDWPLWVGPAPWRDYNRLFHINPIPGVVPWSFCDDFGTASVTWHHSHSADVIQYALGFEESGPVEIIHPSSGRYPTLTCKYANGTLLHMLENWDQVKTLYHALPDSARLAGNFGGLFIGERGWITTMSTGGLIEGGPEGIFDEIGLQTRQVAIGTNNHHANWFECLRSRSRPYCDAELGHRSASLGHLIIIAYRLGRSLKWDPLREIFPGDETANRLCSRTLREPWRI